MFVKYMGLKMSAKLVSQYVLKRQTNLLRRQREPCRFQSTSPPSIRKRLGNAVSSLDAIWEKPWILSNESNVKALTSSWKTYASNRGLSSWLVESKGDEALRLMLLSKLLSYPLTLGRYLEDITDLTYHETIDIAVLGARAEATLPMKFWEELSMLHPKCSVKLRMIGEQIPKQLHATQQVSRNGQLVATFDCSNLTRSSQIESCHAAVLFNSGVGHIVESNNWAVAMKILASQTSMPLLFTSFNDGDWNNDVQFAKQFFATSSNPRSINLLHENPMASMWEEHDGATGTPVNANDKGFIVLPELNCDTNPKH